MDMLSHCELCPRRCGVNRLAGETGYCGAGARVEVYRWAAHGGEEPPISGSRGSGTVFFGRCTLRCLYCQNHPWSQEGQASACDTAQLADRLRALAVGGCHNWNLVSPTPWLPQVREALAAARATGHALPVVYNTSGYERVETLAEWASEVDLYLADLRYANDETARAASGASGYVAIARAALTEMWAQTGKLVLADDGTARRGTICRILILPGHADEAMANLRWLAEHIGTEVAVSVMAQYVPAYRAIHHGEWGRRITRREYEDVVGLVEDLGFENGWIQNMDERVPEDLVGFRMPAGGS